MKEKLALDDSKRLEEQFIKLNQLNGKHLIITIGNQGCLYRKGNEIVRFPAYRTQVVDTCGAGDIFHGAFAYCVANKIPFNETLRIVSMSSSIAVSRKGSHDSPNEEKLRLLSSNEKFNKYKKYADCFIEVISVFSFMRYQGFKQKIICNYPSLMI